MRQWLSIRTAGICLALGFALMAFAVKANPVPETENGAPKTDAESNARQQLLRS